MRFASLAVLMATGTALSGCAGNQLDAIANLSSSCTSTTQTLDCSGPNSGSTTGGGGTTPPTTTPVTSPNTGNTSTITTGDTTLALDNGILVSRANNTAVSTLTQSTLPTSTAQLAINTNTSSNAIWPTTKVMNEYAAGTAKGSGIGGTYKEYHLITKDAGLASTQDEELQVWKWNAGTGSSYATQYRDVTTGGNPATHQAWSFGGNYTTAAQMQTSGSATYSGQFTSVATTSNFINPTGTTQTLDRNNIWSVTGNTALTANFGTNGTVTGTLTPTAWKAWQTLNGASGFATATNPITIPDNGVPYANAANWFGAAQGGFMDQQIQLAGTITTNTSTTSGTHANVIKGTAQYDPNSNWINTSSNSFFEAGFFGNNADNITGVFAMDAQTLAPIGGSTAINDDRRGFVSMTGIFNACKTGPVC